MANVWFGSDFHFGHNAIARFRVGPWETEEQHRKFIINECNKVITKRDRLYILGDAAFNLPGLWSIHEIDCLDKILVRGNHDKEHLHHYQSVFKDVLGLAKYKEFWLSHAPIHPAELRGKVNLHGHVHYESIVNDKGLLDPRYFNCCVENLLKLVNRPVISLEEIRSYYRDI